VKDREPNEMYPGCLLAPDETLEQHNRPENRARRLEIHQKAKAILKKKLKPGDRIYAVRGECGYGYAYYTFAGWDGGWIVTASGIDTIIPASVRRINGKDFKIEDHI